MTITSLAHNIDPTDEDSWTYDTQMIKKFNENGICTISWKLIVVMLVTL